MTAARDNVEYVEAFKAQLFNPNTMSDELKVVKEAQDNVIGIYKVEHRRSSRRCARARSSSGSTTRAVPTARRTSITQCPRNQPVER